MALIMLQSKGYVNGGTIDVQALRYTLAALGGKASLQMADHSSLSFGFFSRLRNGQEKDGQHPICRFSITNPCEARGSEAEP